MSSTYDEYIVRLGDLIKLRAQEDRLVTEYVLRGEWDHAAAAAKKAEEIDHAIRRMMMSRYVEGSVPAPDL